MPLGCFPNLFAHSGRKFTANLNFKSSYAHASYTFQRSCNAGEKTAILLHVNYLENQCNANELKAQIPFRLRATFSMELFLSIGLIGQVLSLHHHLPQLHKVLLILEFLFHIQHLQGHHLYLDFEKINSHIERITWTKLCGPVKPDQIYQLKALTLCTYNLYINKQRYGLLGYWKAYELLEERWL